MRESDDLPFLEQLPMVQLLGESKYAEIGEYNCGWFEDRIDAS